MRKMNIYKYIITLIFVLFFSVTYANADTSCEGAEYACAHCVYKSTRFGTNIGYVIKSNGQTISVTRDKSTWTKKAENWMSMDSTYTIGNDNIVGEYFIQKNSKGEKTLICLKNIYFLLRNMSYAIDVYYSDPGGQSEELSLEASVSNNKNVYSASKVKSCTYKLYKKSGMGYQTLGEATIVSDGKDIISQSFSNPDVGADTSADYSNIAKLFDVNAGDGAGCPNLYIVCYNNICTISTDGIGGWDTKGTETETRVDTPTKQVTPDQAVYTDKVNYSNLCTGEEGIRSAFKILGTIIYVLKIVAPLLIIVTGIIDYFKAMTSSDEEALSKATQTLARRIISGILVFFIPTILWAILSLLDITDGIHDLNNSEFGVCTKCLLKNECTGNTDSGGTPDRTSGSSSIKQQMVQ